ncbi:MAG: DHH family phosphoesterase [Candidatus Woesearchaeota archaeon]|jgi:single-stranded DNA-specific DHH superfamily exonuclease
MKTLASNITDIREEIKIIIKQKIPTYIFHHNDADGICSSEVLKNALEINNVNVETFHFEREFKNEIEKVFDKISKSRKSKKRIIVTDLGSGIEDYLDEQCKNNNCIGFQIDHHDTKSTANDVRENFHCLNSEYYNIQKKDKRINASLLTYYVLREIPSLRIIKGNMAHIALVGGLGDDIDILNPAKIGKKINILEDCEAIQTNDGFSFKFHGDNISTKTVLEHINLLSCIGYEKEDIILAREILEKGYTEKNREYLEKLYQYKKNAFEKLKKHIKEGNSIHNGNSLFMFDTYIDDLNCFEETSENKIHTFGPKTIGLFCDEIVNELPYFSQISKDSMIVGIQPYKRPKQKTQEYKIDKISFRASQNIKAKIDEGTFPSLKTTKKHFEEIFPDEVIGYGMHSTVGAMYIQSSSRDRIIEELIKFYKAIKP